MTDSERLNWLEDFFKNVGDPFVGYNADPDIDCDDSADGLMPVGFRLVFGAACKPEVCHVSDTLRGVIDEAMKSTLAR